MKSAAIIGCGRPPQSNAGHKVGWGIAYAHAEGYLKAFPDIELYAVEPLAENREAFARRVGLPAERCFVSAEALYARTRPDCVSICTWPGLHVPQAKAAMDHGVSAVVVEKPIGVSGAEVYNLIEHAHWKKARVAVAHQRRYEPWYEQARSIIADGVLGQNLVIEARVGDDWDILSWTTHWFDMANYLFDATPKRVLAGVDFTGQRRYGHAVENASIIFADYGPSRQATFVTGPAALPGGGVAVRGERGLMQIDQTLKLWTTEGYREIRSPEMAFTDAYAAMFRDFWHNGDDSRCALKHCAAATLTAFAAYESACTQRYVSLPLRTQYAALEVLSHPPTPKPSPSLRIAVLADAHHEWTLDGVTQSGRDGLIDALKALGHSVKFIEASAELTDDAFDGIDVLTIYHTQVKTLPGHRQQVGRWLERRRPLLVSHCGIGAYADWEQFRTAIGRHWVWGGESLPPSRHPHVPCELTVDDPDRFQVPWEAAWLPGDEMYQALGESAAIIPLATAIAPDQSRQVYAWQVADRPNIVAFLPGHRADAFSLPAVRDGMKACLKLLVAADGADVHHG